MALWRASLALLLSFLLCYQVGAAQGLPELQPQLEGIPNGALVEVRMKSGERVSGRFVSYDRATLTLTEGPGAGGASRVIPVRDVATVKVHRRSRTPVWAWVVTGAIVAVVVIVVSVVLIERKNEGG